MELSIIIVNWNTRDLLANCLQSLRSNAKDITIQVIVVDNDSSDGSSQMVRDSFPEVKLLDSGGNLGFGRGSNLGLQYATAPWILFLNPDTEIHDNSLRKMVEFMIENPTVGALGCKIRDISGGTKELGLQWFPSPFTECFKYLAVSRATYKKLPKFFPYHDPEVSGYVQKLFGACLLVRKNVLESVGAFDEQFFMYCEDVDLCQRIKRAGWKLFYLTDAEILHLGGSASSKAPGAFATLMTCESLSKLMRKHHGILGCLSYRGVAFLGAQGRLAMLLGAKLLMVAGLHSVAPDINGSIRKYIAITKWTLGIQRATIQGKCE